MDGKITGRRGNVVYLGLGASGIEEGSRAAWHLSVRVSTIPSYHSYPLKGRGGMCLGGSQSYLDQRRSTTVSIVLIEWCMSGRVVRGERDGAMSLAWATRGRVLPVLVFAYRPTVSYVRVDDDGQTYACHDGADELKRRRGMAIGGRIVWPLCSWF